MKVIRVEEIDERAEAIWTYEISVEKVLKRLVEKDIFTQEQADEYSAKMFEQLNLDKIPGVRLSSIGRKMRSPESSFNIFVSLTDIAREKDNKSPGYLVQCWMRSSNTVEYLRLWEKINNPEFLDDECDKLIEVIRTTPTTLTPKMWAGTTKAIGIISKAGKYGGTMAHPEIAEAFRAWLFPEVMLEMVRQCRMQSSESEATT